MVSSPLRCVLLGFQGFGLVCVTPARVRDAKTSTAGGARILIGLQPKQTNKAHNEASFCSANVRYVYLNRSRRFNRMQSPSRLCSLSQRRTLNELF